MREGIRGNGRANGSADRCVLRADEERACESRRGLSPRSLAAPSSRARGTGIARIGIHDELRRREPEATGCRRRRRRDARAGVPAECSGSDREITRCARAMHRRVHDGVDALLFVDVKSPRRAMEHGELIAVLTRYEVAATEAALEKGAIDESAFRQRR